MTVDIVARDELLVRPLTAVLATSWTRGRIHAVPVWYRFSEGTFRILTERGSQKHRNALRSGRATLCIDEREQLYRFVMVEGGVTVVDPVSYEQRLALHVHYRGESAAHRIVDAGGHEKMVMLVLHPERWLDRGS
ncbi:MAG: pyridoxamine 5'-phosphate oxidase family protein [Dehalococcoidia bacterium]